MIITLNHSNPFLSLCLIYRIESNKKCLFVSGLVNLQYLDLSYNNISDIDPEAFKYLRHLRTLEIRRNSLTMVSDWTLPLRSLDILDIAQNCLVQLSSTLSLASLRELDVSDNMLVELSEETLDSLVELKRLDLSYNKLSAVPPVSNMAGLTELSLSGNMIKTLDDSSLAGLRALQVAFMREYAPKRIFVIQDFIISMNVREQNCIFLNLFKV